MVFSEAQERTWRVQGHGGRQGAGLAWVLGFGRPEGGVSLDMWLHDACICIPHHTPRRLSRVPFVHFSVGYRPAQHIA